MTFNKFQELFLTKYPEGEVVMHGKFGGTEHNMKTTVTFNRNSKCYFYYGSYETVLNRLGIKVITKSSLAQIEHELAYYMENNGKPNPFSLFNKSVMNYEKEIKEYTDKLENIKKDWIIV